MTVGKNSLKRARTASGSPEKAAGTENTKKEVLSAKPEEKSLTVSQSDGVNAHYGINTPLPVFLL